MQPASERPKLIREIAATERERAALEYLWKFWARPKQLAPNWPWRIWLLLSGRGFGKTRCEVEWARDKAQRLPRSRGALVARTAADVRDVLVEGESGILAVSPKWFMPKYEPSKRRLSWPNGTTATLFSADQPDLLRGPQHHWAICDELAAWQYVDEAWANLMLGLRLGSNPQVVVATTPRPIAAIKQMVKDPTVAVTRGSTYENRSNLADAFFTEVIRRYEGTRLGRQELNAEILEAREGALWQRDMMQYVRDVPDMARVVVAIDPATTAGEDSDETGIVVAGKGVDGTAYVLADMSCRMSPQGWAKRAIDAYRRWSADRIVAEVNNGGDMVEMVLRTVESKIPYSKIHASRGKIVRAEPVAALYEQKRVVHAGMFAELEDEMCNFVLGDSDGLDDRVDALVYALTELMLVPDRKATAGKVNFYGS